MDFSITVVQNLSQELLTKTLTSAAHEIMTRVGLIAVTVLLNQCVDH